MPLGSALRKDCTVPQKTRQKGTASLLELSYVEAAQRAVIGCPVPDSSLSAGNLSTMDKTGALKTRVEGRKSTGKFKRRR